MTRTVRWITVLALAVLSVPTVAVLGQSPAAALFREALLLERADARPRPARKPRAPVWDCRSSGILPKRTAVA
jgi:hypothetical protein